MSPPGVQLMRHTAKAVVRMQKRALQCRRVPSGPGDTPRAGLVRDDARPQRYASRRTIHEHDHATDRVAHLLLHWVSRADPCRHETLSLIHISEPTRRTPISYAVF